MSELRRQRSSACWRFEASRQSVGVLPRCWLCLCFGAAAEEVRCVQCETVFQRATRVSTGARILIILFILLILLDYGSVDQVAVVR
jgi:hypothetical protein